MSGARRLRPAEDAAPAGRPAVDTHQSLVRPGFQPTLPILLRGRGRPLGIAVAVALLALAAALAVARTAGSAAEPSVLVHRQPDFSLLLREGALRRVDPVGNEHVRLEGRGRAVEVSVSVAPLPRTPAGNAPALAELPIGTDRLLDALRRRRGDLTVLDEGRARVNGAPGYQLRHSSGSPEAPRTGHEVLLVPEPPATGAGLHVSLVQRNAAPALGPEDRRLAYEAKRAFRSVRFGTERP